MNEKPKIGPLCEDANALEVRDDRTGETRIEKTMDRHATVRNLRESNGPVKPVNYCPVDEDDDGN